MNVTEKRIKIARTKSGSPCLWESYTEFNDLKRSTVIIDKNGNVKECIFIRKYGSKQALVPIKEGDFVIKHFKDSDGDSTSVLKVKSISNTSNHAEMLLVFRKTPTGVYGDLDPSFNESVKAAANKFNDKKLVLSKLIEK